MKLEFLKFLKVFHEAGNSFLILGGSAGWFLINVFLIKKKQRVLYSEKSRWLNWLNFNALDYFIAVTRDTTRNTTYRLRNANNNI